MSVIGTYQVIVNEQTYDCNIYSTVVEATPTTVAGGSYWEIKVNDQTGYLGLWPASSTEQSQFAVPLVYTRNNAAFYLMTQVVNNVHVSITQSANQTITITCNGQAYTSDFDILYGTKYTATVTTNNNKLNPGTLNIASSGTITTDLSFSVTPVTSKSVTFSAGSISTSNQTLAYQVIGSTTRNVTLPAVVPYYDVSDNGASLVATKFKLTITPSANYKHGQVTYNGTQVIAVSTGAGSVTKNVADYSGTVTIAVTAAAIVQHTVTINSNANATITCKVGSQTYTAPATFKVNHGTQITLSCTPKSGYSFVQWTYTEGTSTNSILAASAVLKKVDEGE